MGVGEVYTQLEKQEQKKSFPVCRLPQCKVTQVSMYVQQQLPALMLHLIPQVGQVNI